MQHPHEFPYYNRTVSNLVSNSVLCVTFTHTSTRVGSWQLEISRIHDPGDVTSTPTLFLLADCLIHELKALTLRALCIYF